MAEICQPSTRQFQHFPSLGEELKEGGVSGYYCAGNTTLLIGGAYQPRKEWGLGRNVPPIVV